VIGNVDARDGVIVSLSVIKLVEDGNLRWDVGDACFLDIVTLFHQFNYDWNGSGDTSEQL